MSQTTRSVLLCALAAAAVTWGLFSACLGQTTAPTTPAPSKPPGVALRGHITIPATWGQSKPDLSRAIVYLGSSATLDRVAPPAPPAVVAQHDKSFDPAFSVISRGTTVEFPNWDHFDHNVFSRSAAAPAFDLSRYPYGQSKSLKFDKTGAIQLFCNIHPEMRTIIFVAPNPYFTRADRDGRFVLANVPPGGYDLCVWTERCPELHAKITVETAPPAALELTLKEDRDTALANDPPRPKADYGVERGLSVKREQLNLPVVQGAHSAPTSPPAASR